MLFVSIIILIVLSIVIIVLKKKSSQVTFPTVKIGTQEWTSKNIALTKDRDGNKLVLGKDYFYPDGDEKNVEMYGLLYTWEAAMRIAPKGWHLPTDEEWTQLTDYVSSRKEYVCGDDGENIAKALASTSGWKSKTETYAVGNNSSTNNASGFSALPAGCYNGDDYGGLGIDGDFWSATETNSSMAYIRYLYCGRASVARNDYSKFYGFSVRCVRDN